MTESLADGLSVIGLVVGFPLLLLGFMISLERLESWGLRDSDAVTREAPPARDAIDAVVVEAERQATRAPVEESTPVGGRASP